MTEVFETLYPACRRCGIGVFEFWDYTYGELIEILEIYKETRDNEVKERISNNYQLAYLTAIFTNRANNGKNPPTLFELYPELFEDEQQEQEDNSWMIYKELMLDYTIEHNKTTKGVSK